MKLKEIFHLLLFVYSQLNLQLCLPWLEGETESYSMPITWLFQPQLPVIFLESEAILSHGGGCKGSKNPLRIQNVYGSL